MREAVVDPAHAPLPTEPVIGPPRREGRALVWLAAGWLTVAVGAAVLADVLPLKPYARILGEPIRPLGLRIHEPLGSDIFGRSVLSRVVYGARVSLTVGFASVVIALVVGTSIGLVAGYFRKRADSLIGVLINTMLALPPLFLLLAITAIFTQRMSTLLGALAVVTTPTFARMARAHTISVAQREFVTASRAMGASHLRIMFRGILPNIAFPVASYSFLVVAVVVVAEGSLSFLGLGVPPPQPTWGGMIAAGQPYLDSAPQLVFVPAMCLLLTVLSLNVLGDRARRHFDTRSSML